MFDCRTGTVSEALWFHKSVRARYSIPVAQIWQVIAEHFFVFAGTRVVGNTVKSIKQKSECDNSIYYSGGDNDDHKNCGDSAIIIITTTILSIRIIANSFHTRGFPNSRLWRHSRDGAISSIIIFKC
jgi:hypothetical protein